MIYYLLYPLHTTFSFFNVFRYITFQDYYCIYYSAFDFSVFGSVDDPEIAGNANRPADKR